MKKILVGISGGIDSAVTAALFKEEGYEVIGVHLKLDSEQKDETEILSKIAHQLSIECHVLDVKDDFKDKVIGYFRIEHLSGNSPSPCAMCNPDFKWKHLIDFAEKHNIEHIASGHYIQKIYKDGKWWLKKGLDPKKDQSYFLWGLEQHALAKISTPLGEKTKEQTKNLAGKYELDFLQQKKESTGLCFSGGLSYPELIKKHIPETEQISTGDILNSSGEIIGKHKGFIYYTIGQKRDLDLYSPDGLCVTGIDAKKNILIAGKPTDLWKTNFSINNYRFVDLQAALECDKLEVKVRGFGWNPDGYGKIELVDKNSIEVQLESPAWAPAPGQPAVFYHNDILLGGGFIS